MTVLLQILLEELHREAAIIEGYARELAAVASLLEPEEEGTARALRDAGRRHQVRALELRARVAAHLATSEAGRTHGT